MRRQLSDQYAAFVAGSADVSADAFAKRVRADAWALLSRLDPTGDSRRALILDPGPAALGEEVQNNFHRLINGDRVNGWNNQLRNEPGLTLTYERRWRPFFRLSRPSAGQAVF